MKDERKLNHLLRSSRICDNQRQKHWEGVQTFSSAARRVPGYALDSPRSSFPLRCRPERSERCLCPAKRHSYSFRAGMGKEKNVPFLQISHCTAILLFRILCLLNTRAHLLHIAPQERIGRSVDSTPVHRDLNLLQKLQDDQTVAQIPAEDKQN